MDLAALLHQDEKPTVLPATTIKLGKNKAGKSYYNFPTENVILKKVELWFAKLDKPHVDPRYPDNKPKYSATFVLGSDPKSEVVSSVFTAIDGIAKRDFIEQTKKGGKVASSLPLDFGKLKEKKLKIGVASDDPDKEGFFVGQYFLKATMGDWGKVEVFKRSNQPGKKIELMTPDEIAVIGNGSLVTANIALQGYYNASDNFGVKATIHGVLVHVAKAKGYQADNSGVFEGMSDDDFVVEVEKEEMPF